MKLVYLGSPEAAVQPLEALVKAGHEILLVVSQPDRRRGRGSAAGPSPVKAAALALGLRVTDDVNDILQAVDAGAELGVVVAYGQLIRKPLLAALPFINLHFSLLPRWRGAAPVERALLCGDTETGVCLMGLEAGLDTGPVYERVVTPILDTDDLPTLRARLVRIGTEMLVRRLSGGIGGLGTPEPQVGESTYAAKLDPAEFEIDWSAAAVVTGRLVRLGVAFTTFRSRRLKILQARVVPAAYTADDASTPAIAPGRLDGLRVGTGDGWLELVRVQPEGKAAMDAQAWRNGAQPTESDEMGQ
jgi:methionyl-tRNA formyltransferase